MHRNIYNELVVYPVVVAVCAMIILFRLWSMGELRDDTLVIAICATLIATVVVVGILRAIYRQHALVVRVSESDQEFTEHELAAQRRYEALYEQIMTTLDQLEIEIGSRRSSSDPLGRKHLIVTRDGLMWYKVTEEEMSRLDPDSGVDRDFVGRRTYIFNSANGVRHVQTVSHGYIVGEEEPFYVQQGTARLPEELFTASEWELEFLLGRLRAEFEGGGVLH